MRKPSVCVTFLQVSEYGCLSCHRVLYDLSVCRSAHCAIEFKMIKETKTIWYPGHPHPFSCYPQSTCLRGPLGEGHNQQSVDIRDPQREADTKSIPVMYSNRYQEGSGSRAEQNGWGAHDGTGPISLSC